MNGAENSKNTVPLTSPSMNVSAQSSCRQQHFRTPKCESGDPPIWGSDMA